MTSDPTADDPIYQPWSVRVDGELPGLPGAIPCAFVPVAPLDDPMRLTAARAFCRGVNDTATGSMWAVPIDPLVDVIPHAEHLGPLSPGVAPPDPAVYPAFYLSRFANEITFGLYDLSLGGAEAEALIEWGDDDGTPCLRAWDDSWRLFDDLRFRMIWQALANRDSKRATRDDLAAMFRAHGFYEVRPDRAKEDG